MRSNPIHAQIVCPVKSWLAGLITSTARISSLPLVIVLAAVVLSACIPPAGPPRTAETSAPSTGGGWYQVYFTQPESPSAGSYRGGPDQELADAIAAARLSVDMAVQDLNLWSIRDALIDAHRRGVAVRLVVESDYMDEDEVQEIKAAGVPVLGDRREGLMHNKFTVIDRQEVWSGSMNYTISEGYRNNNNLLRLRSSRLAQNYSTEFEEMFTDDRFGPGPHAETPYPELTVDGVDLEVYFSPDDSTAERLVELVHRAEHSVYFLAFSFTLDELAQALVERGRAGVDVAGVMDASQVASNTGSDYDFFREAGLDVRMDGNEDNMHHKLLIIDERIVVTGSYNFSRSAEGRNDENSLVIHSPEIAAQYMEEYQRVFAAAQR